MDPQTADPPPAEPAADFTPPDPAGADRDEYLRDSVEAQELYDRAAREAAGGDENAAVVHLLRASKLAEAAREWYLAAAACHRAGDVYRSHGAPYDPARAVRMYYRAVAAYERCGMLGEAGELAYRAGCLKLWRGRELGIGWGRRAGMFAFWAVAGFGLRPLRVLLAAVAVVLGYAAAYWAVGGVTGPGGAAVAVDFPTAVYFSGVTFTTVGYGDLVPAPHARLLAMTEGGLGFVTVSFFVVVLTNRLRF
ncbi:MAG: hypothetical protein C0501_29860 [Isosphaera sp.]|nr:hypothetical protein [Isosphaera sp.]